MSERFDAVVIGAGQAGPALCARLDREGLKTALIERRRLGGTCVNDGCIPTKTLVGSARAIHMARRGAEYGFAAGEIRVDMAAVKQRKDGVVRQSQEGLAAWIGGLGLSPLGFLIAVNLLFLALGCFIDATTMLLVLVPVLLPSVAALGIDPVYFGVLIVFNITIGLVTPPYGLLLFVLAALTKIPLGEIIRECWGLIASMIAALALLVAFPGLVLWLPRVLGYLK